jgi:hypothetical protein
MGRVWKLLLFVIVLAILGFIGFAYLGDLTPVQMPVSEPVEIDAD